MPRNDDEELNGDWDEVRLSDDERIENYQGLNVVVDKEKFDASRKHGANHQHKQKVSSPFLQLPSKSHPAPPIQPNMMPLQSPAAIPSPRSSKHGGPPMQMMPQEYGSNPQEGPQIFKFLGSIADKAKQFFGGDSDHIQSTGIPGALPHTPKISSPMNPGPGFMNGMPENPAGFMNGAPGNPGPGFVNGNPGNPGPGMMKMNPGNSGPGMKMNQGNPSPGMMKMNMGNPSPGMMKMNMGNPAPTPLMQHQQPMPPQFMPPNNLYGPPVSPGPAPYMMQQPPPYSHLPQYPGLPGYADFPRPFRRYSSLPDYDTGSAMLNDPYYNKFGMSLNRKKTKKPKPPKNYKGDALTPAGWDLSLEDDSDDEVLHETTGGLGTDLISSQAPILVLLVAGLTFFLTRSQSSSSTTTVPLEGAASQTIDSALSSIQRGAMIAILLSAIIVVWRFSSFQSGSARDQDEVPPAGLFPQDLMGFERNELPPSIFSVGNMQMYPFMRAPIMGGMPGFPVPMLGPGQMGPAPGGLPGFPNLFPNKEMPIMPMGMGMNMAMNMGVPRIFPEYFGMDDEEDDEEEYEDDEDEEIFRKKQYYLPGGGYTPKVAPGFKKEKKTAPFIPPFKIPGVSNEMMKEENKHTYYEPMPPLPGIDDPELESSVFDTLKKGPNKEMLQEAEKKKSDIKGSEGKPKGKANERITATSKKKDEFYVDDYSCKPYGPPPIRYRGVNT